jgi:hypothetical protein
VKILHVECGVYDSNSRKGDLGLSSSIRCFKQRSTSDTANTFVIDESVSTMAVEVDYHEKEQYFRNVVAQYANLKELGDSINESIGSVMLCYVIETTLFYATNLSTIFNMSEWHSKLAVTHFLLGCCGIFGLSADISRKVWCAVIPLVAYLTITWFTRYMVQLHGCGFPN